VEKKQENRILFVSKTVLFSYKSLCVNMPYDL